VSEWGFLPLLSPCPDGTSAPCRRRYGLPRT
jgi:hypothetical protein